MEFEHNRRMLEGILHYMRSGECCWRILANPFFRNVPELLRECDGAIVQIYEQAIAKMVLSFNIPLVSTVNSMFTPDIPAVFNDDEAIGKLAAEYLLSLKCRTFGYVGYYYPRIWANHRGLAFAEILKKQGYECLFLSKIEQVEEPIFKLAWGRRTLEEWLKNLPPATGVFACTDYIAVMVLEAARKLGIGVPDDIAVLGVDDNVMLCEMASIPLSSIATDAKRCGFEAAKMLDALLNNRKIKNKIIKIKPLDVLVRRSTEGFAIKDKAVSRALSFIYNNAYQRITVSDVLKAAPFASRRGLERRFKKLLGDTIYNTILRTKVARAKKVLVETNLPLSVVAEQSGFASSKKLSQHFKKNTKLTPSEYRRKFQLL